MERANRGQLQEARLVGDSRGSVYISELHTRGLVEWDLILLYT